MGLQKFVAREKREYPNGAIGWSPGGPMDCLGPYAKVEHCLIHGTGLRRTCYATGYADTAWSVPAAFSFKGKTVRGFFTIEENKEWNENGVVFHVFDTDKHLIPAPYWVSVDTDSNQMEG